ncbi:MAG: hypothetical protein JW727_03105 [Candidatus Aenigmarchaeota archaeon]|nr:hypothetical protein [Candidatus Aenigmarchaeota archaeon]
MTAKKKSSVKVAKKAVKRVAKPAKTVKKTIKKTVVKPIATKGAKARTDFSKILQQAERKYDREVTVLLRSIDTAERIGNTKTLMVARQIAKNWIEYFIALRQVIQKTCSPKDQSTKASVAFIDDQIKFFQILVKELERKLGEMRVKTLRQSLR